MTEERKRKKEKDRCEGDEEEGDKRGRESRERWWKGKKERTWEGIGAGRRRGVYLNKNQNRAVDLFQLVL